MNPDRFQIVLLSRLFSKLFFYLFLSPSSHFVLKKLKWQLAKFENGICEFEKEVREKTEMFYLMKIIILPILIKNIYDTGSM